MREESDVRIVASWMYAISKYGYPPSVEDTYRAITELAGMGMRHIELEGLASLGTGDMNIDEVYDARREIRRCCLDSGVEVVCFYGILPDLVSLDRARRESAHELFAKAVEIAAELSCDFAATDSFVPPLDYGEIRPYTGEMAYGKEFVARIPEDFEWQEQWKVLVDSFRRCAERSAQYGLRFVVEPRVGEMISNTDALIAVIDAVDHPAFGGILDTGHQHAQKELLPLSVEKLGGRLFYVHASDNDGRDNHHLAVGDGTIDWEGLFMALKKNGYAGDVAVDIGNVPDLTGAMVRSKEALEQLARTYFR